MLEKALTTEDFRGNSAWQHKFRIPDFTEQMKLFSIIEGTQESLARLGLDYVDIVFAHRHDHNGIS